MNALPRGRNIRVKELQMRKLFYFTSILLVSAGMTFAQSSTGSSGSTPADQSGAAATSTGSPSSDQTTLTGCISKSGDNFILTDQNGTPYKLDGSGLDAH